MIMSAGANYLINMSKFMLGEYKLAQLYNSLQSTCALCVIIVGGYHGGTLLFILAKLFRW